jgi:hypothetical protein
MCCLQLQGQERVKQETSSRQSKILMGKSLGKWLESPGKIWENKIRMGDGLNWLRIMSHAIKKNNKFCLLLCLITKMVSYIRKIKYTTCT